MESIAGLGLDLRAGVHVGEVSRMGSHDLSGLAVHFAQRLCARAEGGQVLVSEAVRDACRGSGIAFEEEGKVQLKGIPGAVGGVRGPPVAHGRDRPVVDM